RGSTPSGAREILVGDPYPWVSPTANDSVPLRGTDRPPVRFKLRHHRNMRWECSRVCYSLNDSEETMANGNKPVEQMPQVAYRNLRFLESADARALRILSEYLDPLAHLRKAGVQHTVVFFGSARILPRETAIQNLRDVEQHIKESSVAALQAELKRARMGVH